MKALLISGNTLQEWNVKETLKTPSKAMDIERLLQYEYDNTIGKYTEGMNYLEVEQFNNTYNNFN
jgi:hypothetical protein